MRALLLSLACLLLLPAVAAAEGPPLATPEADLRAALECSDAPQGSSRPPVLLVHGTFTTPQESWVPGYRRVLPTMGFQTCTVDLPGRATEDVQTSSEFVVFAIRDIARRTGRKVTVVGHSQGTLQPLWALRFWPDVAGLTGEYVGLAGPYNGTEAANLQCSRGSCFEAAWQFRPGSNFLKALFSAGPPAGVELSSIATTNDQLVYPQPQSSVLYGKTPVLVQDLCPGRPVDHASLLYDAATFALVTDAITNAGPVDVKRVDPAVCNETTLRGADPVGMSTALAGFSQGLAEAQATAPQATAEPPLRCYASGACPAGSAPNALTPAGSGTGPSGTGTGPSGSSPSETTAPLRLTRRCIGRGRLRVDVVGGTSTVRAFRVRLGSRTIARDTRGPRFRVVIGRRAIKRSRARALRVSVQLRGGGAKALRRSLPRCGVKA